MSWASLYNIYQAIENMKQHQLKWVFLLQNEYVEKFSFVTLITVIYNTNLQPIMIYYFQLFSFYETSHTIYKQFIQSYTHYSSGNNYTSIKRKEWNIQKIYYKTVINVTENMFLDKTLGQDPFSNIYFNIAII